MLRRKEMLVIVVAQIAITLVLTSAKPHSGFAAEWKNAGYLFLEQRFAGR